MTALFPYPLKVLRDLEQKVQVQLSVIRCALERSNQHLRSRLTGPEGYGDRGGVNNIYSRLNRLKVCHRCQAADVMAMELQWDVYLLLQASDETIREVWRQSGCHILDAYAIRPHLNQFMRHFHIVI